MEARKEFVARQQEAAARQAAADAAARKAAEDALVNGESNMVAETPATVAWPEGQVRATGLDKVAGGLRLGRAGDVAFARDLLNSGQMPLGSVSVPEHAVEAGDSTSGSRAAKPALGLG